MGLKPKTVHNMSNESCRPSFTKRMGQTVTKKRISDIILHKTDSSVFMVNPNLMRRGRIYKWLFAICNMYFSLKFIFISWFFWLFSFGFCLQQFPIQQAHGRRLTSLKNIRIHGSRDAAFTQPLFTVKTRTSSISLERAARFCSSSSDLMASYICE